MIVAHLQLHWWILELHVQNRAAVPGTDEILAHGGQTDGDGGGRAWSSDLVSCVQLRVPVPDF